MKIVFAATGEIAVPLLEALNEAKLVSLVLTAPDAPGKRGKSLIPSPVKVKALELGLDVYQPDTIRKEARTHIASYCADTLLSFCYGKIFGPKFLSLFENKYNIHPSLLPKYRGCSPLYESIKNLDREGGISIQEIALEVDSGDIIASTSFPLDGTETLSSLEAEVASISAEFAGSVFSNIGSYGKRRQDGTPSFSRLLAKEDGEVDSSASGAAIHALIRASYPWPKAFTTYNGEKLSLCSVSGSAFSLEENNEYEAGTVVALDRKRGLKIAAKDSFIYVDRLQSPSRKELDALSFVNGNRDIIGAHLGR